MLGHARVETTKNVYLNARELHLMGENYLVA